ncbi:ectopic P granules protein 5 homolog [Haliotis cracherodii]|uniref:ectopic P granules protein 5 homolog n=1 Tax=Haliotis cracherodii TaxID=6455 RepID=UPI0039E99CCC
MIKTKSKMAEAVRDKPRKSKSKKDGKDNRTKKKKESLNTISKSTGSPFPQVLEESEKEASDSLKSVLQDLSRTDTEEQAPSEDDHPAQEADTEEQAPSEDDHPAGDLPDARTSDMPVDPGLEPARTESDVCKDEEEDEKVQVSGIGAVVIDTGQHKPMGPEAVSEEPAVGSSDGVQGVSEPAIDGLVDVQTESVSRAEPVKELDAASNLLNSDEVEESNSELQSEAAHMYPSLPSDVAVPVPALDSASVPPCVDIQESVEEDTDLFYSLTQQDKTPVSAETVASSNEGGDVDVKQDTAEDENVDVGDLSNICDDEPNSKAKEHNAEIVAPKDMQQEEHPLAEASSMFTDEVHEARDVTGDSLTDVQAEGATGMSRQESQSEHSAEDSYEFVPKAKKPEPVSVKLTEQQPQSNLIDVLETIESFPKPELEKESAKAEADVRTEPCAHAGPLPKPEVRERVVHRKVYGETAQVFKPMTIEQIQALYYNPQLAKNPQFIESFVVKEAKKDGHEFFEILLSYFRSRKNLISAEEDVKGLQSSYVKLQEEMWITTTKSISAQSVCGDGSKVSTTHLYETCKLNEDSLHSMQVTLQTIRDHIQEELTLHAYSSQLSKLQVESYLHNLFMNSPGLRDIPKNTPVHAAASHRPDLQHQVHKLRDCISVLFVFHRRPIKDVEFVTNIRQWTDRLVAALLRVATFDDHLFTLNHVLRCPTGVGKWATKLIQVPDPGPCSMQGAFGSPVLDHLVTALATVLFPTQCREEFMSQMRTSLTNESVQMENTWILVDSDGEEDEDPSHAWLYLHENDIVSILMQFPITAVFAHVLKATIDESGTSHYRIEHSLEADMMRTFAFCTCWVNLLGSGLQTYCMARYRQLNKRLGKMIRQTVSYVSDHWLNFKAHNSGRLNPGALTRLQMEFDQFFMRSTYCILTAQKLGSWQFMADMPYTCVSSDSMWQLLWVLHQGQSHTLNLDTLPPVEHCQGYLKDPDSRQQLADNLLSLQTSETIYLLTTFANMAQCRPEEEVDFIQTVSFGVFEISYTCSHTREFCSKVGRELLSSIVIRHPFILSLLLQRSKEVMPKLGMMSLYLFRELPMWSWLPSDPDMLVLRQWLLLSDLAQPQNQLARLVLSRMNWSIERQTGAPVLSVRLHRQVALLLVECYSKYISNRHMGAVIGEGIRQMASVVRQNQTQEQQFNNWAWDLLLKLKLHKHSIPSPSLQLAAEMEPPDLLKDDHLMPVSRGLKLKNPVACFVALTMTSIGHNITSFVTEGMDYLISLTTCNQFSAVIHIISCIVPYFYDSPMYFLQSEGFLKIQQTLLAADESLFKMAKSVLGSQFPGTVTKQFTDMIQSQICSAVPGKATLVILFWLKALMKVPRWSTDRNCCYMVDSLVERAFTVLGAIDEMKLVFTQAFKDIRKSDQNQGLVTSVVSWIASGVTLPSLMERNSFPEFTWLASMILVVEADYEADTKLWLSLVQEMYTDTKLSPDQAHRRVVPKLKLEQAPVFARLNIYRWAQQALDTPVSHPFLPVVWQRFFLLYLGRQVFDSSLPQRASVGERFFDSMSYSSMLKRMKKRLGEAADYHMYSHTKKDKGNNTEDTSGSDEETPQRQPGYSSSKEFHQKLARMYQTFALWLDEPRLHDANLYLPSLPAQYDSARLLQVFQNQMVPWLEFVDLESVRHQLAKSAEDWSKLVNSASSDDVRKTMLNPELDPLKAADRILVRLRHYDPPVSPPPLCTLKAPVPDISAAILVEKHSLIHLLDADLNTLRDYTRVFSTRVAQHCAVDGIYLDLLPVLYSNELNQVTLTIECKSKVNPLHRCTNPAVATVQVNEKTINKSVQRKMDENRAEYKQVMIECLLPPPPSVCTAAVHVENAITMLIKLSQSSTDESRLATLFDIANTLFYHLATMINEDTNFYLPTKQFFSSCLEILGQEFLSRDSSQTQLLLQFCLDNPNLSCHVSQHFIPNNSPETYVLMYEQLIHILQQRNMDLVFALLTKFDVWTWLQTSNPPQVDRKRFVGILGSALMSCGAEPERKTKLVFDLYCSHLNSYLQTNFPQNLSDVLSLVIQGSAVERLHVQCWEILLGECFTPVTQSLAPQQRKPSICFSLCDVEACTDTVLATTQLTETLQWLSNQFMQLRLQDSETASFGLYPKWNRYIPYVSHFLGGLMRSFVTKMLPNFTEMNPYQVLDMTWKQVLDLFAAWIQPLSNPQQTWYPWIESDSLLALEMVAMFRKVVDYIRIQFSAKMADMDGRVLGMLLMYHMNCLSTPALPICIADIYNQELRQLPWEQLKPDLQLLEMMAQLKERVTAPCFHLIGYILTKVTWNELVQYLMIYQPPDMTARFQSALLILLVQCYGDKSLLEKPESVKLLTAAENFNWLYVGSSSYKVASNWFMQCCDPVCVLAERSSALALGLKLMRVGAGFSNDPGVPWSEDLSTKRLMYVHCITQLLCQCSYRADINTEAISTVIVNLLTEIEAVETSVLDMKTQQEESLDLVKDVLSLLNNCNPDSNALSVVMTTITDWLKSSPHSILLTPCIKAANRCLASLQQMVQITEACIEVYFTADQNTGSSGQWDHILAVFQMPELNVSDCINEAIDQGSYLMLYAHTLQQIPLCQSYDDELKLMDNLVNWTIDIKPCAENEGKLLLWWQKLLDLILRQLDGGERRVRCILALKKFLIQLNVFGEDRASSGLLGAIGFGKKSALSLKFRIMCRTIAAFLATQIYSDTELRLHPHQALSNTQSARASRTALVSLKTNKQYAQYKEQIDLVCHFVPDQTMCLRDSLALLQQLAQAFFADWHYLKCIQ